MLKVGLPAAMSDVQHKTRECGLYTAHPIGIGKVMGSVLGPNNVKSLKLDQHTAVIRDAMAKLLHNNCISCFI